MSEPVIFEPKTINDLNLAGKEQLVAYLEKHKVPFGKDALKPELLSKAREHFSESAAKPQQEGATAPKLVAPSEVTEDEALKMLEAKGFKDKDEIVHFLNALARKESDLAAREKEVETKIALIERKDDEYAAREEAIKKDVEKFVELNNQNDAQITELRRLRGEK